jgi:hypothetical protein
MSQYILIFILGFLRIGAVAVFLLLIPIFGRFRLKFLFRRSAQRLLASVNKSPEKFYHSRYLEGLPEPVIKYFKKILKEGQPYIQYVRMTHEGQFKTGLDKPWVKIWGEQYAITQKPGFIWKGDTFFFTARDMYLKNKGRLIVNLLSLFKIVDGKGMEYDQGEILRWLGESILYPTQLLPSENLSWSAIDKVSAHFTYRYLGMQLVYKASFNEKDEIFQLETERYMDKKSLETWIIRLSDYKTLNHISIPTRYEVLWRLKTGDEPYARFVLKNLEYNIPKVF